MKNSRGMKREIGKSVNRAPQNNAVFRRPQHKPTTPYPSFPGTIGSGIRAAALSAHEKPARSWREIAQEASHELDPERLMELANELTRALDEQIGSARRWPRSKAVS
jgi:hypothetical protein